MPDQPALPFSAVHQRLFDASPNPYLVLDRKLDIVTANAAYLASTGRALDDIVGRWAWDAFPTDPETLRQAVASFERVIRTREQDTMALLRFDIPRADEAGGGFETRYWTITHTPVFDARGEVEFVLQHPIDVTELQRLREGARLDADKAAGAEAAMVLEQTGLIDRARQVYQANLDLKADVDRLQALFERAPSFMAVLRGPGQVVEFVNEAAIALFGRRDYHGRPVRAVLAELEGQGVFERIDRVYASGQEFVGYNLPVRLQAADARDGSLRYVNLIYQPLVEQGVVAGIFIVGTDVTEQHLARALAEDKVVQLQRAERLLAFQLELADCLRPLASAGEVIEAASRLLGQRLGLARVVFAEIAAASMAVTVRRDWCRPGLASVAGIDTTLDDFGPGMADELRAGHDVLVRDVRQDARTAGHLAAYEAIGVRAHLTLPLLRAGQVRVVLSLHDTAPRGWGGDELRIAQDMAERTWAAVETASAQAELRAERDQSQYIFDTMTEGFGLIDRHWNIVRMNATGLQLVQRPEREVIGLNNWEVFPDTLGSDIEHLCRSVKDGGPAGSVEYPYVARDGRTRWLEVRVFPALDGGLAVFFRDVTPRRIAENRLRETAEHLRFTLDAARLGDWDLDLATGASQRSFLHDQLFGYLAPVPTWTPAIFLGHVHPDDRARAAEEFGAALSAGSVWQTELRVVWADGSVHWLAFSGTVYMDGDPGRDKPRRMAGIVYDISERKRIEEQLRVEGHRKDEFLAMLAHELRNPLAPIGAAADLLALGRLDPAQVSRTSAIIGRQVGHMSSLIDDLLDVSRVTRGLVALASEPVAVEGIVADAVEQVRPLVGARRHALVLETGTERALVAGDRKRLVQVLANLLNNAAKYTPEGGRIRLRVATTATDVVLCVIDNGIGMTPEVQRGAFELFTQAERTPDRAQGGLGIGLALVKSLVELHRGSVAVHSDGPGRGSRFTVRLPRLAASTAGIDAESQDDAGIAAGADKGGGRSVLVVDDNVDAAQLLAMVLENAGHRVRVEHHSHLALELARTTAPEVCILDIGLPDMDGNVLARRLRELPQMRGALLVAVTGYGRAQDRAAALAAGFDHHLVKPVDAATLVKLLE